MMSICCGLKCVDNEGRQTQTLVQKPKSKKSCNQQRFATSVSFFLCGFWQDTYIAVINFLFLTSLYF